jgi:hypothetical protein
MRGIDRGQQKKRYNFAIFFDWRDHCKEFPAYARRIASDGSAVDFSVASLLDPSYGGTTLYLAGMLKTQNASV